MRKPVFAYVKTKKQVTAKLISAFVFATRIVQSHYFLKKKFQVFSHLLSLYSPVCVRNPEDRFSHNEAHLNPLEYLATSKSLEMLGFLELCLKTSTYQQNTVNVFFEVTIRICQPKNVFIALKGTHFHLFVRKFIFVMA